MYRLGFGLAWAQGIVLDRTSKSPHGKRQFWWIVVPIVKYRHFLPCTVQKPEPIDLPFGLWTQVGTSSIVFSRWHQCAIVGGHSAATWRIQLNHPSMVAMRFTSTYFDHLNNVWTRQLRQSHRQPSASSRILYCGHSTQYNYQVGIGTSQFGD